MRVFKIRRNGIPNFATWKLTDLCKTTQILNTTLCKIFVRDHCKRSVKYLKKGKDYLGIVI